MNKRIEELVELSEVPMLDEEGNCKYGDTYFSKEKFVELILKEVCEKVVQPYMSRWSEDHELTTKVKNVFT